MFEENSSQARERTELVEDIRNLGVVMDIPQSKYFIFRL
jgi:hypothetical protein